MGFADRLAQLFNKLTDQNQFEQGDVVIIGTGAATMTGTEEELQMAEQDDGKMGVVQVAIPDSEGRILVIVDNERPLMVDPDLCEKVN